MLFQIWLPVHKPSVLTSTLVLLSLLAEAKSSVLPDKGCSFSIREVLLWCIDFRPVDSTLHLRCTPPRKEIHVVHVPELSNHAPTNNNTRLQCRGSPILTRKEKAITYKFPCYHIVQYAIVVHSVVLTKSSFEQISSIWTL